VAAIDVPVITICGFISLNGKQNGINQAALNSNIRIISHVDSYTEILWFGLITTQVTKVYGE
jgi:hypothetical protein